MKFYEYEIFPFQYEVDEVLTSHSGPVICVAGIYQDSSTIVVSGSSDSTLKLWERKDSSSGNVFQLLQTLSFGLGFVLGFDFHIFENNVILACGTEVGNVEIYTKQNDQVRTLFLILIIPVIIIFTVGKSDITGRP